MLKITQILSFQALLSLKLKNTNNNKNRKEGTDMKKILSIITGLILILTITSCQNDKKIVEKDVKNIIEVSKKGDFKSLNGSIMATMTLEAMGGGYKKLSYKINKITKENKNKIIVNITMKYPDLSEAGKIFKNNATIKILISKIYKRFKQNNRKKKKKKKKSN